MHSAVLGVAGEVGKRQRHVNAALGRAECTLSTLRSPTFNPLASPTLTFCSPLMVLPAAAAMAAAAPPSRLVCTVLGWADGGAGEGVAIPAPPAAWPWPWPCSPPSVLGRRLARLLLGAMLLPASGLQYVLATLPAGPATAVPGTAAAPGAAPPLAAAAAAAGARGDRRPTMPAAGSLRCFLAPSTASSSDRVQPSGRETFRKETEAEAGNEGVLKTASPDCD